MPLTPAAEAALLRPFLADVATARAKMDAAPTYVRLNLTRGDYNAATDALSAARRSLCGPGEADAHEAWRDQCANSDYYTHS